MSVGGGYENAEIDFIVSAERDDFFYVIERSQDSLPGILDSDRFGRRQAVLGGLRKTGIPLPVSCASRYNSAAAIGTGSLR
jgi:hypothetical protein